MAKCFGVKVEVFSIGFGSSLAQFRYGETEYRLAWIPFGGYVKLLGQEPGSEAVEDADKGRSLPDKPPWIRILIYVAGPAMNLVLPFLLLTPYVALSDDFANVPGNAVGAVDRSMPAYLSGMREGDMIKKINGDPINAFWEIKEKVSQFRPDQDPIEFEVSRGPDQEIHRFRVTPRAIENTHPVLGYTDTQYLVGYQPAFLSAEIAVIDPGGALSKGGAKTFDKVISVDGVRTDRFIDVVEALTTPGQHRVEIERLDSLIEPQLPSLTRREKHTLTISGAASMAALGMAHAGTCVTSVAPDGPAQGLLEVGDCLTGVDGETQTLGGFLLRRILDRRDQPKSLSWIRNGQAMTGELRQRATTISDPMAGEVDIWLWGLPFLVKRSCPSSG